MKKSLKDRIYNYIKSQQGFIHKGVICDLAREAKYSAENAGRRLRELETEGLIEVKLNSHGEATYAYIPQQKIIQQPVFLPNGNVRLQEVIVYK